MPRRKRRVPAYRLHRPSGQARVIINREHIYLGKYDTPESHEKYHRLVAEMAGVATIADGTSCDGNRRCRDGVHQRIDPGLLDVRRAAVRQERQAHQRNQELQDRPAAAP